MRRSEAVQLVRPLRTVLLKQKGVASFRSPPRETPRRARIAAADQRPSRRAHSRASIGRRQRKCRRRSASWVDAHCAANIIEHGGGVNNSCRLSSGFGRRRLPSPPTRRSLIPPSPLRHGRLLVSIDLLAVRDGTAALRQTRPLGRAINVPQLDLVWRRRPAEIIRPSRGTQTRPERLAR
jgi:hypothetical protein